MNTLNKREAWEAYQNQISKFRVVSAAHHKVCIAYRAKEVCDAEFEASLQLMNKAQEDTDIAEKLLSESYE